MHENTLQLRNKKGIFFFSLPRWEEKGLIKHGFSSRLGGISKGPFSSLNLGFKGGDTPAAVQENRRRFLALWGQKEEDLILGDQVHGTGIVLVDSSLLKGSTREIPATDGLITAQRGVLLGALSADCLLAFFLDPAAPAIGLAHAGWRGTCSGILFRVVEEMDRHFATRADSLEVLMSPSIGSCCYEIGSQVLDFCNGSPWKNEIVFYPGRKKENPFLDLQQTNINILCRAGIDPAHIFASNYCTRCNRHLFYSYRGAKGGATGSHMGIIGLECGGIDEPA